MLTVTCSKQSLNWIKHKENLIKGPAGPFFNKTVDGYKMLCYYINHLIQ